MARVLHEHQAFGGPGIEPRWTRGDKDGVGTAYSADSRVWFTLWNGAVTEVYYPTIDRPQIRDLQLLVTDGDSFFHEEKRHLKTVTKRLSKHALGYEVKNSDPEGRYRIVKEVIVAPHMPCVLQHCRLQAEQQWLSKLKVFALCAPHLQVGGWGNNAHIVEVNERQILTARKGSTWLALAADVPFTQVSCGYVGASDGWTDIARNLRMEWQFDHAADGNVALTGELALEGRQEFTLALTFGDGLHDAITALLQALGISFREHRSRYTEQWQRPCRDILPLEKASGDKGNLYHGSYSLLLSHEDKTFAGAFIASLSIPWGEAKSDEEMGGYHLVWTRDMVNTCMGLLAAGDTHTPLRALIYLAASQEEDGGFPQNFWLNGEPYWTGIQLDEVAFPVLLAWHLHRLVALKEFDPYPMVIRAAGYLIRKGPATQQERWEEAGGYSPSTLASNIAALVCAAGFARERGDDATATYLEQYADFLECHIEKWTVTTEGNLVPGIAEHYIRILPVAVDDATPDENPNRGVLTLANRPPGSRYDFPAKEIVDAGFLELVRYGIRRPDDPLIVNSLKVVDAVLKVDTPVGPCWHRYNHDGYGQRQDGGPYITWGKGRLWPLLTGERGHYELAAGREVKDYIRALEGFASPAGMLPEQVWDEDDRPELHLFLGKPTGAAMPLMWAHSEYIQLLRSAVDGRVFGTIPAVAERYLSTSVDCPKMEIWKPNRQTRTVQTDHTLRIQAPAAFRLRWSRDNWQAPLDTNSTPTVLGIEYVDIAIDNQQRAPIRFTFYWNADERWEGHDYEVAIAK